MADSGDGLTIEKLGEKHKERLSYFDCGHADISEFAKADIFEYQKQRLGVSYVLSGPEGKILSFITLAMGAFKLPPHIGETKLTNVREIPYQFPALKIGRLGTQKTEQKKGHAKKLMQHAFNIAIELRERVGCYYLALDAYPENVRLYEKFGFTPLTTTIVHRETVPMYMRLP